jgi:hypothetical protein
MDPDLRTALLGIGLVFCGFFAIVTISSLIETGISLRTYGDLAALGLYGVSLGIIGMIAVALIGAIRNPPPDE